MKIIEKFKEKSGNLFSERQPVIAVLGDSVTQGCFECYNENGTIKTVFETESGYVEKLKKILSILYPEANPTIINAGISGDNAVNGAKRIDEHVLSFKPDLVIVCYGLNDAMGKEEGIKKYEEALSVIFEKIKAAGAEAVFMTPNLRSDRSDSLIKDEWLKKVADDVVKNERDGMLEMYLKTAEKVCGEKGVRVCDCNSIWKRFKEGGADINALLSNRINHPLRELHWIFAYELVKIMFEN